MNKITFEDLNNDVISYIMKYLSINYLININKRLSALHTEYYYNSRIEGRL